MNFWAAQQNLVIQNSLLLASLNTKFLLLFVYMNVSVSANTCVFKAAKDLKSSLRFHAFLFICIHRFSQNNEPINIILRVRYIFKSIFGKSPLVTIKIMARNYVVIISFVFNVVSHASWNITNMLHRKMATEFGKPRVEKPCSYTSWPNTTLNTWRLKHPAYATNRMNLER